MIVAAIVLTAMFGAVPCDAQTRVALVIGNGSYQNVPALVNPPNDARDMAASLGRLGFTVRQVIDGRLRFLLAFCRPGPLPFIQAAGRGTPARRKTLCWETAR